MSPSAFVVAVGAVVVGVSLSFRDGVVPYSTCLHLVVVVLHSRSYYRHQ